MAGTKSNHIPIESSYEEVNILCCQTLWLGGFGPRHGCATPTHHAETCLQNSSPQGGEWTTPVNFKPQSNTSRYKTPNKTYVNPLTETVRIESLFGTDCQTNAVWSRLPWKISQHLEQAPVQHRDPISLKSKKKQHFILSRVLTLNNSETSNMPLPKSQPEGSSNTINWAPLLAALKIRSGAAAAVHPWSKQISSFHNSWCWVLHVQTSDFT